MARTSWKENDARPYPHCWSEPLSDPHYAGLAFGSRFRCRSRLPPSRRPRLFRLALDLAEDFRPLEEAERAELLAYRRGLQPIFKAADKVYAYQRAM